MRKYGESKTTRIMMATLPHVTSGLGLRKFQADGFLLTRVYILVLLQLSGRPHQNLTFGALKTSKYQTKFEMAVPKKRL